MDEKYLTLRKQLHCLGYTQNFPVESMPLVESLTADLVQTTYSLQHYMKLSKDVLQQRDSLKCAAEPYKCDNAKLIKENNKLHLDLMTCKEEFFNKTNELYLKIRESESDIVLLQDQNKKLKEQYRDLQLHKITAETVSSSMKSVSKSKNAKNEKISKNDQQSANIKVCHTCLDFKSQLEEQSYNLNICKNERSTFIDKIIFMKSQLDERDKEIRRLNNLLEGGRPLSALKKECYHNFDDSEKYTELSSKIIDLEEANMNLNAQLKESLSKQHEAMSRAVQLSDKNDSLKQLLRSTDEMALKLEAECNVRLKEKHANIQSLQNEIRNLTEHLDRCNSKSNCIGSAHEKCAAHLESKNNEIKALRKVLEDTSRVRDDLITENEGLSSILNQPKERDVYDFVNGNRAKKCDCSDAVQREDLLKLLQKERNYYETHINDIKMKLNETRSRNSFDVNDYDKLKSERDYYAREYNILKEKTPREEFVSDLKNKILGLEQHIFRLDNENTVMLEKNNKLKQQLDQMREGYNTSVRSQPILDNLEKDLNNANREISRLEMERNMLMNRLKNATEGESTYRHLYEVRLPEEINNNASSLQKIQQECNNLRENLKISEGELLHMKTMYNQLKSLQVESDKTVSDAQAQLYDTRKEINALKNTLMSTEKLKNELDYEVKLLKSDKSSLRENVNQIDRDRDKLIMDIDEKTERISSLEHHLRSKNTSIELLENKITELSKKLEMLTTENASLEHKSRDSQTCNEALSLELDTITKQRDNSLIENRRLQSDLAAVTSDLRTLKREYDVSRKEVEEMKQQLQHYVDEVRRIEDILSRKEAERTEMLDHFASLSHEATVLETNNHSLENEAASKNYQLQAAQEKMSDIERKLKSRESIVEMQEEKIASLLYKISTLETELGKQKDVNKNTEQMLTHAQEMCKMLDSQKHNILIGVGEADSENKNLMLDLKLLKNEKKALEESLNKDKASIESLETLLSDSRREIVQLRMSLQAINEENRILRSKADIIQKLESESLSNRQRTEEAAKHLQELQMQMTDERYQRVRGNTSQPRPSSFYPSGTL